MDFKLRFSEDQIRRWADCYPAEEDQTVEEVAEKAWERGFLTPEELKLICKWKSPRPERWVDGNSESYSREVTSAALASNDERFRIEVLTLLSGVSWPSASVILHLVHEDPYPILDFRALWSLGFSVPPPYNFDFWSAYTDYCRDVAQRNGVTMRVLDRALWQYSKKRQRAC